MKALAMLFLLGATSGAVLADSATWLNVGGFSHHFETSWDRKAKYNEENFGLGLEREINGLNYLAGFYANSIGRTSRYLVAEKIIYRRGVIGVGLLGGIVDGYLLNDGGIIPAAAITATIEHNGMGARFMFMPGIKFVSAPVLSIQFRLKIN